MGKAGMVWVGLNAHKESISVHRLVGWAGTGDSWTVTPDERPVRRLARKLRLEVGATEIRCCYEAGRLGIALE